MNAPNLNPMEPNLSIGGGQPAPVGGVPMGGQPTPMEGQQAPMLSQEQMKGNLQDLMSKIEGQYQDFNSQKFAADNQLAEQQSMSLSQVYDLFESVGVDPNSVEEVQMFLDKIREQNPELAQQLESTLSAMIGEETTPQMGAEVATEQEAPLENNMNINNYETPQKTI